MTAPGVTFSSATAPPPSTTAPRTGMAFVTGICERGLPNTPILIQSMQDYTRLLGARITAGVLYDWCDAYFRDGGSQVTVSRLVGAAAVTATLMLQDGAGTPANTLKVNANSPGAWGNSLQIQVTHPSSSTYQLIITRTGTTGPVETSPVLSVPADAVSWSTTSNYVTIVDQSSATVAPNNNPAVLAATSLATGADDNGSISETVWTNGLAVFTLDLGPGQVCAPGRTTDAAHQALLTHATSNNRTALLDAADTATAATITTAATNALTGGLDGSRGTLLAPWVIYPGIPTGGAVPTPTRTIPPSALVAARCCAADRTGNPGTAAAGPMGKSSFAIGVTQVYVDSDRATLNTAGVSLVRSIAGVVQLYGYRSLATDPQWMQLGRGRLRMAIQDRAMAAGQAIQFGQLDAKGNLLSAFNGALRGILQDYFQAGALYGTSPSDAFSVNTGPQVNTPTTIANGYANAVLQIRPDAAAEFVTIQLQSVPITQAVAAA